MKNSTELKQERASLIDAQVGLKNLVEKREDGHNVFSEDETTRFDALQVKIEALNASIIRSEKFEANLANRSAKGVTVEAPAVHRSTKNEVFSLTKALHTLACGKELTGISAEVNERGVAEMKDQGMPVKDGLRLNLPSDLGFQSRAQTITGNLGNKGGALVETSVRTVFPLVPNIDVLTNLGVTVLSGLTGDVTLPTSGLFNFSHVGETADVSVTDISFSGPTLKPHRCAGVGAISNQFLKQASISAENYLRNIMNNAYGVAIITDFLNGDEGDSAPKGLYSWISTNTVNTPVNDPTKAIVTELESLVDAANGTRVSRGYLSGTKLANMMKNTKIDEGSGQFLFDGQDLNGYKYERTTLMPELTHDPDGDGASGNITVYPLIFGDFSQAVVGYYGNVSIMVDPYTLASSSQARIIIEGFDDVAVTNEKAFAINKGIQVPT